MRKRVSLLLLVSLLPGCSRALLLNGLYSHTTEPLTFNRNPTELRGNEELVKGEVTALQYPMTAVLSVRIGKNGIGDVAKEGGMNKVYFADMERKSAIFGLWSSEVIHIYGK